MQVNPLLSIVIPTYNRADFLDYCLKVHIPLAKAHNIQIFISDNASIDATKEVVQKWMEEYPLLSYHCNETNIGMDENFERALKYPRTEYVWLLGDTYQIPPRGIDYIINLISKNSKKYDAIVVNVAKRVSGTPEQDYSDQNQLLSDLGWHMTCLSSLIYNSRLIDHSDFVRYHNTNFIQLGIIFEYIAGKDFLIHWIDFVSVQGISIDGLLKESWQNQAFEIWTKGWPNLIFSLPPLYTLETKLKCIKDHGKKSGLFKIKKLLYFRAFNILNYKTYKQYSHLFPLTIKYPKLIILLIVLLPRGPLLLLYKSYKTFKRRNRGKYGIY